MMTFQRVLKTGFISFRRNVWLSSATILVLTLSLSVALGIFLFGIVVDGIVAELESKVDISVYFKLEAPEEKIAEVRSTVEQFPKVVETRYTSRDEALSRFKERHASNDVIQSALSEIKGNPLEASLAIRAADASAYQSLASLLEGRFSDTISKVNYRENSIIIDKIFSVTNAIRVGGMAVGSILFFIAGLIAYNTIRLAIFSFKDEIAIMRLVGASNWFIRGPFVVEAMLSGIAGAALTFFLFFGIVWFVRDPVSNFIPGVDLVDYYKVHGFELLGFVMLLGVMTCVLSSGIAIRRYLRV